MAKTSYEKHLAAVNEAAERVTYRLTYDVTAPRECRDGGIGGPDLPNSYFHLYGPKKGRSEVGSGAWEDPDHPRSDRPQDHVDRWFVTAIREAIHEALEWYWVDGHQYLNPHGRDESVIHEMSENFAYALVRLKHEADR